MLSSIVLLLTLIAHNTVFMWYRYQNRTPFGSLINLASCYANYFWKNILLFNLSTCNSHCSDKYTCHGFRHEILCAHNNTQFWWLDQYWKFNLLNHSNCKLLLVNYSDHAMIWIPYFWTRKSFDNNLLFLLCD